MSLIVGTTNMGREWAAARMLETCQVGTITEGGFDEVTGEPAETFAVAYEGPCEFKMGGADAMRPQDLDSAEQLLVSQYATLKLPVADDARIVSGTSALVRKNMRVKVLTSETDPGLVGVQATVKAPAFGAFTTARRFTVEVVS